MKKCGEMSGDELVIWSISNLKMTIRKQMIDAAVRRVMEYEPNIPGPLLCSAIYSVARYGEPKEYVSRFMSNVCAEFSRVTR